MANIVKIPMKIIHETKKRITSLFRGIKNIRPTLKKEVGILWLFFLLKCFTKANLLFSKTHWAGENTDEARYVKLLSLIPALYLNLIEMNGKDRAYNAMQKILTAITIDEDKSEAKESGLYYIKNPYERWLGYEKHLLIEGSGAFNKYDIISKEHMKIHIKVVNCVFHEFLSEAGTPELTRFLCDSDKIFHPLLFPEYSFNRNGSWENTIGCGAKKCDFVWEAKQK